MPLAAGTRLGPYEIVAPIGAGGMGEVYRARDTRLGRDVALKVLPADFASDAERLRRFEQEARHASALNHPNIVAIHDVGSERDSHYVVMELVEGESLRALVRRGPLPARKLLDLAVQIADGLAAAHAAGIVHRDLKPENVMITREGRVKILDFGLAKQTDKVRAAAAEATVDTVTHAGTVLGTSAYMSPEQARGQAVDFRSDLFSFGLVLYEMASGKKAFQRDSAPQTLSAIISEEAPPLEAKLPAPLRWTIDRCLAKEPRERHDSTRDLYQELRYLREHLSETLSSTEARAALAAPRRWWSRIPFWVAAGSLAALAAVFVLGWLSVPPPPDLARYSYTPLATDRATQTDPAWSPDGKSIAYRAMVGDRGQVFARSLDSAVPVQLTTLREGTSGGMWSQGIFWSADSQRVFFVTGANPAGIWSVSVAGGDPQSVLDKAVIGTLSPDGHTLAALRTVDGVTTVWLSSPPGAPPQKYAPAPFEKRGFRNVPQLHFSPDGRKLLLLIRGEGDEERWLLPFPLGSGQPRQVLDHLPGAFTPAFSWMPDSRHIVVSAEAAYDSPRRLWLADTQGGQVRSLSIGNQQERFPSVSSDGRRIAFMVDLSDYDLVEVPLDGKPARPLLATGRMEAMPAWSPAAAQFAFVTNRTGRMEIWMKSQQEGWERPVVTPREFTGEETRGFTTPAISPDGMRLAYVRLAPNPRIWISSVAGSTPARLTTEENMQYAPTWSPDGKWIAFRNAAAGTASLAKVRVGSGALPVVLKQGIVVAVPEWSPAGEWIVCRTNQGWELVSPDGQKNRVLGFSESPALVFSKDGKTLYGLRREQGQAVLFAIDVETGKDKTIGPVGDITPASPLVPGIRFSLAPDGKSFITSVIRQRSDIWMLEGFDYKPSLLERLGLRR